MAPPQNPRADSERPVLASRNMVSPAYDLVFFILSPLMALGLGRIYDKLAGNDPTVGRCLDITLNFYIYAGTIAAGATLMHHVNDFSEFEKVNSFFFTEIPAYVEFNSGILSWLAIDTGAPFLFY